MRKKRFVSCSVTLTVLMIFSCSQDYQYNECYEKEFTTLAGARKTRAAEGHDYIDYMDCPILPGSDTVIIGDYVKVSVVLSWTGGFIKRSISGDEGYSSVSACEAWVEGPMTGSAAINYCDVAWDGSTSHLVGTIGVEGNYIPYGHTLGGYPYNFERFVDFPTSNIELDTIQIN